MLLLSLILSFFICKMGVVMVEPALCLHRCLEPTGPLDYPTQTRDQKILVSPCVSSCKDLP